MNWHQYQYSRPIKISIHKKSNMNTCPRRFLGMEMKGLCSTCDIIIDDDDVGDDWQNSHADDYDDSDDYDDGDDGYDSEDTDDQDHGHDESWVNLELSTSLFCYLDMDWEWLVIYTYCQ